MDESAEGITIYPNPASQYITIAGLLENKGTVQVLNNLGQIIRTYQLQSDNSRLSIRDIEPGMYCLQVVEQNSIIRKSFIIK